MSNELHTHSLWEALYAITSTAENLLSFCDHPRSEPLDDDWVGTIRSELRDGELRCIAGMRDPKTAPVFADHSVDAKHVNQLVIMLARDGQQLATLLHNRPELSTVRYEQWPPARQALYNAVFAAVRELGRVRDRLAELTAAEYQNDREGGTSLGSVKMPLEELTKKGAFFNILAAIDRTHRTEADCPVSMVATSDGQYLSYRDPAAGWQVFPKRLEPNQAKAIEALCYARQNPESPPPELDPSQKKQLRTLRQDLASVAPWILPPGPYRIGDPPTA